MKHISCLLIFLLGKIFVFGQAPLCQWAKGAGGSGNEYNDKVAVDAAGNVFVAGNFESPSVIFGTDTLTNLNAGFTDIYTVKYDASGNVLWAKKGSGLGFDDVYSIATDAAGNVIVVGFHQSPTLTFDAVTVTNAAFYENIFIVKYDPSGNVLWAKSEGGTDSDFGTGVATDLNGNIIMTGYFYSSSITFGSITLNNAGQTPDLFVVKYNATGTVLWAKKENGVGWDPYCVTDLSGNVLVSGIFYTDSISFGSTTLINSGYGDIFLVKYNTSGTVLWAKSAGGTDGEYSLDIDADLNGNVLITGVFFSDTIHFGTSFFVNAGQDDMYFAKYSASGNLLWANSIGGASYDDVTGIATDINGNVLATGSFCSPSISFGNINLITLYNSLGNCDEFIAKFNPAGNVLWARNLGALGNSITTDLNRNILVAGEFDSVCTIGTMVLTSNPGSADMFIAKLDSSDCSSYYTLYADTIPHNWIAVNQAMGLAPLTYLWDWGDGNTSVGPTPSHTYSTAGYYNICLTITDLAGCVSTYCDSSTYLYKGTSGNTMVTINVILPTGIRVIDVHESRVNLYPNPAANYFTVVWENNKKTDIIITDISGKVIYQTSSVHDNKIEINTENFADGIYIIRIHSPEFTETKKLVVAKQ